MMATVAPLKDVFRNDDFAWQILEQQIKLDSGINIDGEDIARLLGLYMRGVETLNSVRDPRELYFRNRLNNLMMRPNVVKVLSSDSKRKQGSNLNQSAPIKTQTAMGQYRKGQLQMKLTYAKEEHNEQKLKKMVVEHNSKISTITDTVENTISVSRSRLEQRIQQRKLKSVTARERSLVTNQQKFEKVERNNMEALDEIKEQHEEKEHHRKPKQRTHSLDVKLISNYVSVVEVPQVRRVSLLLPSRKPSD